MWTNSELASNVELANQVDCEKSFFFLSIFSLMLDFCLKLYQATDVCLPSDPEHVCFSTGWADGGE